MQQIINWLNANNGFVMSILTLVYVLATIVICFYNYKSANATKLQIKKSKEEFIEKSRAHVIPKITELEGEIICLMFENIGESVATNLKIDVNEDWLKKLELTKTFPEVAESLRTIRNEELFFTVGQKIYYGLCVPGNGYDDFKTLSEQTLKIIISYTTLNKKYKEVYRIPLKAYNYIVNQSDYVRLTRKRIKELQNINNSLKNIKNS